MKGPLTAIARTRRRQIRRKGCQGFTLVQLLVVLGILALLAALLFPVFASVRERGRQGVCLSNLHQLGQAFSMYREDYGSYPPWQNPPQSVMPYVKDRGLFFCPSTEEPIGIDRSSSYDFLIDGDRLRYGEKLDSRAVIAYCRDHTTRRGPGDRYGGVFTVLRHDGAAEIIPAGKVRLSSHRMPNVEPWFGGSVEQLTFPR